METLLNLGLALALGLLVRVERGWQERGASEGSRIAGIRTFGLIGLLDGLWPLLAGVAGVDAITVTLSRWAGSDASLRSASIAVLAAAMVNTVTKAVLTAVMGGYGTATQVAWPLAISLLVGAIAA